MPSSIAGGERQRCGPLAILGDWSWGFSSLELPPPFFNEKVLWHFCSILTSCLHVFPPRMSPEAYSYLKSNLLVCF